MTKRFPKQQPLLDITNVKTIWASIKICAIKTTEIKKEKKEVRKKEGKKEEGGI